MRKKQDKTEYNRKYREANRERLRLYARKFRKEGRATRNLKKQREAILEWEKKNPEKRKAHRLVYNAIRNGTLKRKPCKVCKSKAVQAHHEDYSKPLEVIWLCRVHHYEFDLKLKKTAS